MNLPKDSVWPIIAAIVVVFTAMLDPRVSIIISVGLLIALSVYNFVENREKQPHL